MIEVSEITGKTYESEECVYFRNCVQSAFYIANHCTIQDIFTDSNMKLVFVFKKDEHRKILPLWMANKENNVKGG